MSRNFASAAAGATSRSSSPSSSSSSCSTCSICSTCVQTSDSSSALPSGNASPPPIVPSVAPRQPPLASPLSVVPVAVYPAIRNRHFRAGNGPRRSRPLASFHFLPSHPLTVLRDLFYCPADFVIIDQGQGAGDNPNSLNRKTSPSYFFIDGVFYVDDRDHDAEDYSVNVLFWMTDTVKPQRSLVTASMHDTTFADLAPTANTSSVRPYMFVHQGSCAHSVTFGDLIPAAVPNDTTAYPIQLPSAPGPDPRERIKKCQLCSKGKAEWVTVQDQRADRDFCLWCSSCFEAFHLEQDGSLAYDVEYHRVELPDL